MTTRISVQGDEPLRNEIRELFEAAEDAGETRVRVVIRDGYSTRSYLWTPAIGQRMKLIRAQREAERTGKPGPKRRKAVR